MNKKARFVLTLVLIFISLSSYCQIDTILYFGTNGKLVDDIESAKKYQEFKKVEENKFMLTSYRKEMDVWGTPDVEEIFLLEDGRYQISKQLEDKKKKKRKKKSEASRESSNFVIREVKDTMGYFLIIDYYPNNEIKQVGFSKTVFPLNKLHTWLCSYENGELKSKEVYSNNQLIENRRWDDQGNELIPNVFWDADTMPSFGKDLMEFRKAIAKNLRYPQEAAEKGKQGKIYTQFIVMEDGRIEELKVVRGVYPSLDAEALRAVWSAGRKRWTPGYIDGKPVRVQLMFPVVFVIQ